MSVFPVEKTNRLRCLLEEERELLAQIDVLTDEQEKLLAADDIGEFGRSLDRRQKLIDKIDGLHQESDVLMQSYMSSSTSENGGKIAAIEKLRAQLREVLTEVARKNEKNMAAAKAMSEQYIAQWNKLNMSRKSIGLYNQTVAGEGEYFDKKT